MKKVFFFFFEYVEMQHFSILRKKMLLENFTMKCTLFQNPSCLFCFVFVWFVCFVENSTNCGLDSEIKLVSLSQPFSMNSLFTKKEKKKKFSSTFSCILWKMLMFLGEFRAKIHVISIVAVANLLPSVVCGTQLVIGKAKQMV